MSIAADIRRRLRLGFRRRTQPGALPGTVVADPRAPAPTIRVLSYGPEDFSEEQPTQVASLAAARGQRPVTWIDVQGLGDADLIEELGRQFGLHPLALEDVVNTHQRPKVEDYGDHLFIVARMLVSGERSRTEQVSMFLGKDFVITFQEQAGDCLEPVRMRIRGAKGRIRRAGPDYLAYAILDAVVDAYFPVLQHYGEWLDALDDEVSSRPTPETIVGIHDLRAHLLMLRRAIWPLRDEVGELVRETNPLISDETCVFLRDCYDHTLQIIDLVETCREMCSDLREYYLSTINNRMSEVMKVLTIIATVFIPMSFIAGVYGMNFNTGASAWNMPELRWSLGYPFALGLMAAIAAALLAYFWRRGWIGR
jgi:magnesium transporter